MNVDINFLPWMQYILTFLFFFFLIKITSSGEMDCVQCRVIIKKINIFTKIIQLT